MNTPVFPRRTGSLRARGHGPYRDTSGVEGQSKLWVFLSCCRLLEEKEEQEEEGEGGVRRGRLGLEEQSSTRSEASSEETLRNSRWRRGVCRGGAGEEETLSSGGLEEVSRPPQSPDSVFLVREAELLLWVESERRLWAESRVLSAASIFLSNIFLVS